MRHFLVCHFIYSPQARVDWAVLDNTGHIINSATDVLLDTVPRQYPDVIALLPGTDVTIIQASVPSKRKQRIIQAIPFVLEEFLAADVEKLHFALGEPETGSGKIPVAVIARTTLESYLHSLHSIGLKPKKVIPDFSILAKPNNGWSIAYLGQAGQQALVHLEQNKGFTIESKELQKLLSIAIQEAEPNPPQQLRVLSRYSVDLTPLHSLGIPIVTQIEEQGIFAGLKPSVFNNSLNLLQGDYRLADKFVDSWRPLRLTLGLLCILAGLNVAAQLVEYRQLTEQRRVLTEKIHTLYRETFPDARKIVNPRAQMEYQLQQLKNQANTLNKEDNFLVFLANISIPLSQAPGLILKRIDYHDHQFELELELAQLQALEQLRLAINQQGFVTEILSATSQNNLVEARLTVKMNQPTL